MNTEKTNDIIAYTIILREAMNQDSRVLAMLNSEKIMESDIEVQHLSCQFHQFENELNTLLKNYDLASPHVIEAQVRLALAKKHLEEHPLVASYRVNYQVVQTLYATINQVIFRPFDHHLGGNCAYSHHRG